MNRSFKYEKKVIVSLCLCILTWISCTDQNLNSTHFKKRGFKWNIENEKIHNENRNDSTKVSKLKWEADTKNIELNQRPMVYGIFPVPDYDLADSTFVGLGNTGAWEGIKFQDKTIIHHSLFVTKSDVNKEFIPEKPNEVYFTILALTDTVDTKNYSHTNVDAISNNHPHYVGQGFIKTTSNEIDFLAFLNADRNEYAIVNMRLFDLRIGRIVLIAPQKDGTFRSLQLESPILSSYEMKTYVKNLLKNTEVIDFFTRPGNI